MQEALFITAFMSCINATILTTLKKWGVFEWLQVSGWIYEPCMFCLGFWFAFVELLFLISATLIYNDPLLPVMAYVAIPFAAASITNFLFNANR